MVTPITALEPRMTAAVTGVPAGRDPTATTRTIALGLLAVELNTLAVTGVALYFVYRPAGAHGFADAVRHRVTSALTLPTAVVVAVLLVLAPTAAGSSATTSVSPSSAQPKSPPPP